MTLIHKSSAFILAGILFLSACQKHGGIPQTLSVSPTIDTLDGIVTITGSGFSTTPSDNKVQFNDTSYGKVFTATPTQLTVLVPWFTTKGRITVTVGSTRQQTAQEFTVVPKFNPWLEAPGYPLTIDAGGGENISDYTVSFTGSPEKVNPLGMVENIMTVVIPSDATTGKVTVNYQGQPYTSLIDLTIAPVGEVTSLTQTGILKYPTGMTCDANGNLFVSDLQGGVIDKIDPNTGAVSTFAGNGSYAYNGGGPILSAGIYGAMSLAFEPDGNLYAINQFYGQVYKITSDSVTSLMSVGGSGAVTALSPSGIAFDGAGNLYTAANLQLREISPNGTVTILAGNGTPGADQVPTPAASATFMGPTALQLDGSGNLYVCDQELVRVLSNGIMSTLAGGNINGLIVDGVGMTAGFTRVNDMVRDPRTGNLFITDPGDHVIRMITSDGAVTTVAGKTGQQGMQNGTGPAALFEGPTGIAMDKNGVLYVSDGAGSNSSIRKIILH